MSKPTADKVIKYAKKFMRKAPYGTPNTFTRWYYDNNTAAPWCGIFVYYCLAHTGGKELMKGCANKAYVPTVWNWAKAKGYTISSGSKAKQGDLVIFDWNKDKVCDHIGFIIRDNGNDTVQTLEGNTSNISNGNGGCVQIRIRNKGLIKGYVRLPYAKKKSTKKKTGKVIAKDGLNIRSGAGAKHKRVGGLKRGAKVTCHATIKEGNNIWWKIGSGKYVCAIQSNKRYIK